MSMSVHSLHLCKRKSSHLFASAVFSILLVALQLALFSSPPVVASPVHRAANTPPPEDVARAGPSVVRLLVTYGTLTSPIQCTGVGVIVSSWTSQGTLEPNNWVLTDGALVNPDEATCVSATVHIKAKLISIQIMMSSAYNTQGATFVLSASATAGLDVRCAGACQNGPVLFAFATDQTLPFLDLVPASSGNVASSTLALVKSAMSLTIPPASDTKNGATYATTSAQFITPVKAPTGSPVVVNEAGMPEVDAHGGLVGLHLKNGSLFSSQDITAFMNQQIKLPAQRSNLVHDNWNAGITAFYQGPSHYHQARQAFTAVFTANSQFQGAETFLQFTNSTTTLPPGSKGNTVRDTILGLPLLMLLLGSFVILLLVALAIVIILRLRRQPKAIPEFQAEWAEAERIASVTLEEEIRRQQQAWAQQQQAQQMLPPAESKFYPRTQLAKPPDTPVQAKPEVVPGQPVISNVSRCPSCSKPVLDSAKYCPNCRLPLSSPVSGPPVSVQPPPTSTMSVRPTEEVKLPVPASPVLPVSEQPKPDKSSTPIPPTEPSPVPAEQIVQHRPKEIVRSNDRVGQRLGNYKLVRLLGYGAFADVYLGEHRFLKTQAAIKVLQKRLTRDALVNFLAEGRTIAELIHPHIVRVLEFGVEGSEADIEQSGSDGEAIVDGIPFLVMDYAPGGTLRKRHPKGTQLPLATIVPYVMQVAEALQYAHGKKLIHRDVKAENILIGRHGEILLSDFGIAAVAHSDGSMTTQEMAGTVPYMAPEQIRGKPRPASDQYALAVVVYEWLCGTRPFNGSSIDVMMQHMTISPPRLREHVPTLSPKVEKVVLRALAKDPLQRFESVQAFANALKQAAG
ncbi:MAG TPA: protein kinase [Ktedonobacteraceae bacterium]|nr:protein kinase [Ktedonobacteraceae bacterium]